MKKIKMKINLEPKGKESGTIEEMKQKYPSGNGSALFVLFSPLLIIWWFVLSIVAWHALISVALLSTKSDEDWGLLFFALIGSLVAPFFLLEAALTKIRFTSHSIRYKTPFAKAIERKMSEIDYIEKKLGSLTIVFADGSRIDIKFFHQNFRKVQPFLAEHSDAEIRTKTA